MNLLDDLESDLPLLGNARIVVSFVFGLKEGSIGFVSNVVFDAWAPPHQNIIRRRAKDALVVHTVSINGVLPILAVGNESFVIGVFDDSRRLDRNLIARNSKRHEFIAALIDGPDMNPRSQAKGFWQYLQ
eukprot:CAMPEP_0197272782 /NCGR_PEP_ID=MMETSP1432-20130617/10375_1 /TAXON_ID=44447 /ORGANISM="Pseudo-nitzschia delicatissima, Strain UNC1205" /LENGTH=129 /DNA_ID=CAMNT_0042738365 /DNA_START=706 /DNA_END=1095 /DNA_ORIENTATION=-